MHFNADNAVSLAGLAPPAFHVEGEPGGCKAPHFGLLGAGKQGAHIVKQPRVGGGIGAGRAAYWGLIYLDHLVQILQAQNLLVRPGMGVGPVQASCQLFIEDFIYQGGLAGAGNPGYAHQLSQGDFHVHLLQVILGRPFYFQEIPAALPALLRPLKYCPVTEALHFSMPFTGPA